MSSVVIDDAARDRFTAGQCGALALALAELSGWPIWWIGSLECVVADSCEGMEIGDHPDTGPYALPDPPLCACQVRHVGVRRPDGAFVDIDGARDLFAARRAFGADFAAPATPMLLDDITRGWRGWDRPRLVDARRYARAVLAQAA